MFQLVIAWWNDDTTIMNFGKLLASFDCEPHGVLEFSIINNLEFSAWRANLSCFKKRKHSARAFYVRICASVCISTPTLYLAARLRNINPNQTRLYDDELGNSNDAASIWSLICPNDDVDWLVSIVCGIVSIHKTTRGILHGNLSIGSINIIELTFEVLFAVLLPLNPSELILSIELDW